MDIEALQRWVGRHQTADDLAAAGPLAGLAGLLDHAAPPWKPGELPPLAHWLYFLPHPRQSLLDDDGHLRRGDFLPPVPLPRRMWVGSRIRFLEPIPVQAAIHRRSTIASVKAHNGRSGPLVFVTVNHEIAVGATTAIVEDQDIVYRAPATGESSAPPGEGTTATGGSAAAATTELPSRVSEATRRIVPDPVQLFRFSALTCNAHRIHYDRDYALGVEGYPGLVVQGPLVATLLMDHFLRVSSSPSVRAFKFRAQRPLFDTAPFDLCLAANGAGADLWVTDRNSAVAFTAEVER